MVWLQIATYDFPYSRSHTAYIQSLILSLRETLFGVRGDNGSHHENCCYQTTTASVQYIIIFESIWVL